MIGLHTFTKQDDVQSAEWMSCSLAGGGTAQEKRMASDREEIARREHSEGEGNVVSHITERDLHQLQEYRRSWREKNKILQGCRHFILCVPRRINRKCIASCGNLRNVKIGNISVQNLPQVCLKIRLFLWISERQRVSVLD